MNRFITRVFLFFLCRSGFFSSLYSFLHWLTLFGGFNLLLNRSRFLRPFNCLLLCSGFFYYSPLRRRFSLFLYSSLSRPGLLTGFDSSFGGSEFFGFFNSFLW